MQTVSESYTTARADPAAWHEYKAVVGGVEYGNDRIMGAPETVKSLFSGNTPAIGCCVAQTVRIGIIDPSPPPPRMAKIELFCRVHGNGVTSEWIPKGVFFTDTRDSVSTPGVLILSGYDAMLKMEQPFVQPVDEGEWPRAMSVVIAEIAERIGVEIEEGTEIPECSAPYPGDLTMREMAGYIAVAAAGNWIITDAGKLRLVKFGAIPNNPVIALGSAAAEFGAHEAFMPFTGVVLTVDEETSYTAGNKPGRSFETSSPWGSQETADNILSAISGYVYQPFQAEDALLDPAAELGDYVEIAGTTGLVATVETVMDLLCAANVSAPADEEIDHEYPYIAPTNREITRKTKQLRSLIEKTDEEIRLSVSGLEGDVAELDLKVGSISMEVSQNTGADGRVYASIVLTVGNNQYTGQILMEGNINVSGQLSADALYAALGDIADLTVDRLSTSRRIVKYLAGDTGDDNYITAEDEVLAFVSGVYAGGVEQAVNPNGLPIYWESDPSAATLGTDGYPYLNGVRIFTTTAVTDWPVYVYTYTELTKAKMAFEVVDGYYTPVLTFGAGDGKGGNIGTIQKSVDGMEIRYVTPEQKTIGITMSNDGYVDIDQRRTQSIQINKSAGKVTVLAEGETTAEEITYTETDNSMTFTWPDGHTATVTIS